MLHQHPLVVQQMPHQEVLVYFQLYHPLGVVMVVLTILLLMDRPQAVVPVVVVHGMALKHLTILAVVVIHPQHLLLKETMAVVVIRVTQIIPVVVVVVHLPLVLMGLVLQVEPVAQDLQTP